MRLLRWLRNLLNRFVDQDFYWKTVLKTKTECCNADWVIENKNKFLCSGCGGDVTYEIFVLIQATIVLQKSNDDDSLQMKCPECTSNMKGFHLIHYHCKSCKNHYTS